MGLRLWDSSKIVYADFGQVSVWHHSRRLIVDSNLESSRAPIHKLLAAFGSNLIILRVKLGEQLYFQDYGVTAVARMYGLVLWLRFFSKLRKSIYIFSCHKVMS